MHASLKNSARFSEEHWSLLRRTFESSPENIRVFSGEHSSLLGRTFESSPENIRDFSEEHSSLLRRTFESSRENIGDFSEEHWSLLGRTLESSRENLPRFTLEDSTLELADEGDRRLILPCYGVDYKRYDVFVVFQSAFVATVIYVVVATIFSAHGIYKYSRAVF